MTNGPPGADRAFLSVVVMLFLASGAITVSWCTSMSAMPGMLMPGGWTMTMTWMRMPGQSWLDGAASFLGMWMVMMAAMMLPSVFPVLARYRASVRTVADTRLGLLTALAGAGYFFVWAAIGAAIYPIGVTLAEAAMRQHALSRAVPALVGAAVVSGVGIQFTGWKARQLACCRAAVRAATLQPTCTAAWVHGLRLGFDCVRCCGNLMAILLALGMMDLRVMAVITALITFERLGPSQITHRASWRRG